MVAWQNLVATVDAVVDAQWGERVRLLPWLPGEYDEGEPDTSRPIVTTVGVMLLEDDIVSSLGGPLERVGRSFGARMVTVEAMLSCSKQSLNGLELRQGDRVHALDRGALFVVERAPEDASGRVKMHLVKAVGP